MGFTRDAIPLSRSEYMLRGLARPAACSVPLFAFLFFSKEAPLVHDFVLRALVVLVSVVLLWGVGLTPSDRGIFSSAIRDRRLSRVVGA